MKRLTNNQKLIITILAGVFIGLLISFVSIRQKQPCTVIGSKCYRLERAEDTESRRQGLSGRQSLDEDKGMLFVFKNPNRQCMWMRDMNFGLDMVWLSDKGQVIHIEENVRLKTYPDSFCAKNDAKYVIELNEGEVADSDLRLGGRVMVN